MKRPGRVVLGLILLSLLAPSSDSLAEIGPVVDEAAGEGDLPAVEAPSPAGDAATPVPAERELAHAGDSKVRSRPGAVPVGAFNPSVGSWWSALTVPARVWVVLVSLVAGWFLYDALVDDTEEQSASPM